MPQPRMAGEGPPPASDSSKARLSEADRDRVRRIGSQAPAPPQIQPPERNNPPANIGEQVAWTLASKSLPGCKPTKIRVGKRRFGA